jgi:hypothetical protein
MTSHDADSGTLAYRLSGPTPIDHICVKHLRSNLRITVVFVAADTARTLLVGVHDANDPVLNVYTELYRLLGAQPEHDVGRSSHRAATRSNNCRRLWGALDVDILASASQL